MKISDWIKANSGDFPLWNFRYLLTWVTWLQWRIRRSTAGLLRYFAA